MRKSKSGFTIVELIIVIVVIAILATISVVLYKNVQERAKNSQTIGAANQWLKALEIYKVRNGSFPSVSSCLGSNYMYNSDALGTSGIGQCRQDTAAVGVTSNSTFLTAMSPYITGNPTPAMVTAKSTATLWYRGLYYYIGAGNIARLDMALTPANGGCPGQLGDINLNTDATTTDGNYLCTYTIGSSTSY